LRCTMLDRRALPRLIAESQRDVDVRRPRDADGHATKKRDRQVRMLVRVRPAGLRRLFVVSDRCCHHKLARRQRRRSQWRRRAARRPVRTVQHQALWRRVLRWQRTAGRQLGERGEESRRVAQHTTSGTSRTVGNAHDHSKFGFCSWLRVRGRAGRAQRSAMPVSGSTLDPMSRGAHAPEQASVEPGRGAGGLQHSSRAR